MEEKMLNGRNFSNLEEFYHEVENIFLNGKYMGHNLDAFSDILDGGFGELNLFEPFILKWISIDKSRESLGYAETLKFYENMLKRCHESNIQTISKKIEDAKQGLGKTVFGLILDIIEEKEHISFIKIDSCNSDAE